MTIRINIEARKKEKNPLSFYLFHLIETCTNKICKLTTTNCTESQKDSRLINMEQFLLAHTFFFFVVASEGAEEESLVK